MTFSLNNRLVLEPYVKGGLEKKIQNGIATPGQRDGLKGLRVLIETTLSDGTKVPAGSVAYIKEESLHNQPWAAKLFTCDGITNEKFMIVELFHIEFVKTTEVGN